MNKIKLLQPVEQERLKQILLSGDNQDMQDFVLDMINIYRFYEVRNFKKIINTLPIRGGYEYPALDFIDDLEKEIKLFYNK